VSENLTAGSRGVDRLLKRPRDSATAAREDHGPRMLTKGVHGSWRGHRHRSPNGRYLPTPQI
jgi:hypothetical protein